MKKKKFFALAPLTIIIAVVIGIFGVNAEELITTEAELLTCVSPDSSNTETEVEVSCKLGSSIEITNPVEIEDKVNVTLDLNGHSITPSSEYTESMISYGAFIVHNGGTLTVNDSVGTGKIGIGDTTLYAGIVMTKKGDESDKPATLVVNGGTIEGYYYAVVGNGSRPNTSITINDGTLKGLTEDVGLGIFHPQVGTLNVNGGTISGTTGIEMRSGELNVIAGTIIGDKDSLTVKASGSGSTTIGAGVAIAQHNTANDLSVKISGGTIKGYVALNESNPQGNAKEAIDKVAIEITGGTFETINGGTTSIYSENKTSFITGGTFNTYHKEYLATSADITYKLSGDTTFTEKTNILKNTKVTLDLNGKTLTLADNITDNYSVVVAGELTIQGNGTVEIPGPFGIGVTGTLTVKNGTYNQPTGTYLIGNWGTTVIEDGTFNGYYSAVNGFSGNTVEVKGGSFSTELYEDFYWTVLGNAEVSGGTYNNDVTEYVKSGMICRKVGNTYNVGVGYDINVAEVTNGTVSVDKTTALPGEIVTMTITPNEEYSLVSVEVLDEENNSVEITDNTFTMPSSNITINTKFTKIKYAINTDGLTNGTVSVDKTEASKGENVTVTVTPDAEYELSEIIVVDENGTEITVTNNTFEMPSSNVTISVQLTKIKYAVKVTNPENGTVSVDKTEASKGETVTVTVTPDAEYKLSEIKVLDTDNKEVEVTDGKFTMPSGEITVTAELTKIKYTVTTNNPENGTLSVDKTEASKGETVTVTVTPDAEYELSEIKVLDTDNKEVEVTDGKFTMPSGGVTVTAELSQIKYAVKVTNPANGTVSVDKTEASKGETVTVTVTPDAEYKLSEIKVLDTDNKEVEVTDGKFTMPSGGVTVTAELSQIKYAVKVTNPENGTVSVDKKEAVKDEKVTIYVTPEDGYALTGIIVIDENDTEITVTNGTFEMPSSDVTIIVGLTDIRHTVKIEELANGTVSVDKPEADRGDTVTITVTPDAEYELTSIKVVDTDNNEVEVTDGKFVMPNSEVTVSVELTKIKYAVNVTNPENGTISVDKTEASKGDTVIITVTPDTEYELSEIKVLNADNKEVEVTDGKFTMPSGGVTITAELTKIKYAVSTTKPENGTVSVDKTEATKGETVTVTVTPNAEYELTSIKVLDEKNNKIAVTGGKFTMPSGGVTVTVELTKIKYAVKVTNPENGTISVDKTEATKGEIVTINAVPKDGYEITAIKVLDKDNKEVKITDSKFTMPSGGVTVSVELSEISHTAEVTPVDPEKEVEEIEVGVKESEELEDILLESLTETLKDENKNELASKLTNTSAKVEIEISKLEENTIEETVVEAMQETAGDAKIAKFFDITIAVKKNNMLLGTIDTLTKEIELMILLPEELRNNNDNVNRTYYIIRKHGTVVKKLPATLSEDGKSVVFSSKDFSTYALAYVDEAIVSNPQTYDGISLYIVLSTLSLIGIAGTIIFIKKKKLFN